jgi:Zn-dependent protease
MLSLPFSRGGHNLAEPFLFPDSAKFTFHVHSVSDINVVQILIDLSVLLLSLSIHEMAHAWTADRAGDPTARRLGRVSLNPLVHADPIGTILFPLIAMVSGAPLIGWAKPVPVNIRELRNPRRDYVFIAAAGPASNLVLAVAAAVGLMLLPVSPQTLGDGNVSLWIARILSQLVQLNVLLAVFNMVPIPPLDGGNVLAGLLPRSAASVFNQIRPYGFVLLYALILSNGFRLIVMPPYEFILSWLPTH